VDNDPAAPEPVALLAEQIIRTNIAAWQAHVARKQDVSRDQSGGLPFCASRSENVEEDAGAVAMTQHQCLFRTVTRPSVTSSEKLAQASGIFCMVVIANT
jgi:hypothetical protein